MPNIFRYTFEEVTFFKSKTNMLFLEDDTYTFYEKHDDLDIDGP